MSERRFRGLLAAGAAAAALLTSGCATAIHGTRQKVEIITAPEGATAEALGQKVRTPGVLVLPRKAASIEIRIEKEGYAARVVRLTRASSGAVWWNLGAIPVGAIGGAYIGVGGSSGDLSDLGRGTVGFGVGAAALPAVGFGIDYGNGAAYRLVPERVVVKLEPAEPVAQSD